MCTQAVGLLLRYNTAIALFIFLGISFLAVHGDPQVRNPRREKTVRLYRVACIRGNKYYSGYVLDHVDRTAL